MFLERREQADAFEFDGYCALTIILIGQAQQH